MKGPLANMLKQAQDMQQKLEDAKQELANMEVSGEAGGGMVKVRMTGRHDVLEVDIDSVLMADDKSMVEDLVAAAVNDAVRKVETARDSRMSELTAGINLPPGIKLPF
jgi:nucleoid-associated protein EbfC